MYCTLRAENKMAAILKMTATAENKMVAILNMTAADLSTPRAENKTTPLE